MSKAVFHLSDGSEAKPSAANDEEQAPEFSVSKFVNSLKEDLIANKLKLPTLPSTAVEALVIINDEGSSVDDLAAVISRDTALTARLIRYANSPLFKGVEPIKAIRPAISRIGFEQTKNAVYAVSMREVFKTPVKAIEQRMQNLWDNSLQVGAQAAALAKQHETLESDVALVAGLVHNIGVIPILTHAIEHTAFIENPDYLDKIISTVHAKLGAGILKHWKFAPELVAVVAEQDQPNRASDGDYVDLVQVAKALLNNGKEIALSDLDEKTVPALGRLQQDRVDLENLRQSARDISAVF